MERKELVRKLEEIQARQQSDHSYYAAPAHEDADQALLDFIDDPEVTNAFYKIDKWYA